jgi:flagellar biosynthesis protein FliR
MPGELALSASTLLGFLLTLVRISGAFVFVPIPGISAAFQPARVLLALGITLALYSSWPRVEGIPSVGQFVFWILVEAALGVGIGLAVAFVAEAFAVGAQVLGLQVGYAFASTIDPVTQADSTVIAIFCQIAAGLMFFTTGLDRQVIQVFAHSLEAYPAGSFVLSRSAAEQIVLVGSTMFSTGMRLALPMVAVLIMIDVSLALLGRVNSQLQLLTVAFPVKMAVGLALLGWTALLFPTLFRTSAEATFRAVHGLIAAR